MTDRPILFSAPMVRALLDGSKTQTRRIMKPQPTPVPDSPDDFWWPCNKHQSMVRVSTVQKPDAHGMAGDASPHGAHGDRIWVRETFYAYGRWVTRYSEKKGRDEWHFIDMTIECDRAYLYEADNPDVPVATGRGGVLPGWYKRPAIFMPRAACRIQLEIVSVRVERLHELNEQDAVAEGIEQMPCGVSNTKLWRNYRPEDSWTPRVCIPQNSFRSLWESINGEENWLANPWVWVVEFKRVTP